MNILAEKQKKILDKNLTEEELQIKTKEFLSLYYELRTKEENMWYSKLTLDQRKKIHKLILAIYKLKNGVIIDGIKTSKAKVKIKRVDRKNNTSIVEITIHEGRNHQVKKMFEAVGYEVLKLKREVFAFLTTGNLKSGEYRKLTIKEVKQLYVLFKNT